jgi:hypothetical protein
MRIRCLTKGKFIAFPISNNAAIYSQRFSSSFAAGTEDYSDMINERPKETIDHTKWIERKEQEFKSTNTCLYSSSRKPFPYNKGFLYHVPLNDFSRKQIYFLYKTQPQEWTVRKLANKFKISVERTDAIIDLEEHEERMFHLGYKVNTAYLSKMETIIGASSDRAREATREVMEFWQRRSPIFVKIPEDQQLTFEQAAKIAQLPSTFIDLNPDNEVAGKLAESNPPKVIQFDEYETNKRHTFIITDIGKNKDKSVTIHSFLLILTF